MQLYIVLRELYIEKEKKRDGVEVNDWFLNVLL